MNHLNILVISPDPKCRSTITDTCSHMGLSTKFASDTKNGTMRIDQLNPVVVLIDAHRYTDPGTRDTGPEWILITPDDRLIETMKRYRGHPIEVLSKPFHPLSLEMALNRALEKFSLRQRLRQRENELHRTEQLVETERLIVVRQIVDKISSFIGQIAANVEGGVRYFNDMPYFVSIHSRELKIVAASSTYKHHFGNRIGDRSWSIYRGDASSKETCPAGTTLSTGNVRTTPATVEYRSGARVPLLVHTAPVFNNDGEVELILEVAAGAREVRNLREELRSTQQRYQQLFDEVPCYVAVLDRQYRITALNRRFKKNFHAETGTDFFDVFSTWARSESRCPIRKTLADGKQHQSEMLLNTRDGRRHNMLIWTSPITTAAKKLIQIMVILADVTDLRRLQDNLSALGLMIGSISHGIKGVLTGLDAGLYLIDSGFYKDNPGQIEEGLEVAKLMQERMRKVIVDILYYARERKLNRSRTDVAQFACDVADQVEHKMLGANIKFICEFDSGLGNFTIDQGVMRSAMVSILENAVEACIDDESEKEHCIRFTASRSNHCIHFSIADNGKGMEQDEANKLFRLFYTTKGSRGTGLGLFLSQRIVREHGGNIDVASAPGQGTRFTVKLPEQPPRQVPEADAGTQDQKIRTL